MSIRPLIINQLTLNDPAARSDCGESAVSMILQAFGINDTPLEEIQDLGHDSFTVFPELVKLLTDNKLVVTGVSGAAMADGLATADALVLIHDNNNADPDPAGAYEHFLVAYRLNSNGTVQCANPWGGRDIAYSRATLAAATIQAALVAQGDQSVNHLDANGAARITAVHLFGTNVASITSNFPKIWVDIEAMGWGPALDKWEAMARSGGEQSDEQDIVGLQAEIKALQSASPVTPSKVPTAPFTATITPQ
jgi:hypothetical protein